MLGLKERKQRKEEEAAAAKAEAEFQAKQTAKQEKRKIEKTIGNIDQTIENFMQKAIVAKGKGNVDVYQKCVGFIKVCKMRRTQAENALFTIESMELMKEIADNSSALLESMGNVMSTLGALSVDKSVLMATQKNYQKTQLELDKQSATIESMLGSMEMLAESSSDNLSVDDGAIEAEIAKRAGDGLDDLDIGGSFSGSSADGIDDDLERLKKLVNG